ncbi:MAG TPA: hypothetical protein VFG45_07700 [Candidatus Nitrosocosmicus sp.]|nr:hypothetical protein [Candidatus Nitrosocosmicus sp.]
MSITDSFKNLFGNQSRISIVIALLSILAVGMTIQPAPHQSVAQSVPLEFDEFLKNPLAASDIDIDILNGLNLCGNSVPVLGLDTFGSVLGDYNDSVCFIVKEFENR